MSKTPKQQSVAEHAASMMAQEGLEIVMWGDGILPSICARSGREQMHPLKAMGVVLDAMARRADLFEPLTIHGHDSRGRARRVRAFKLKAPVGEAGSIP